MNVFETMATISLDTSKYDSGIKSSQSKMKNVATTLGSGLAKAAKVGAVAVGAVATATTAVTTKVVKSTSKVAEYGDNIDKMSQKMGMTAEAYQEWDAVMQHSGTSMGAMKASMKTLANAAQSNSDAFQKLGISQKDIAKMSQQELFEKTISALQNVKNSTERTYLAGKTLGRGATELGALLNTSAKDTQAMRDKVHELGGVMSNEAVKAAARYQDSLQDMNTAIDGAKRNFLSGLMPAITKIMDGISALFSGKGGIKLITQGISEFVNNITSKIPEAIKVGEKIMSSLTSIFLKKLPEFAKFGTELVIGFVNRIIENIPTLLTVGSEIISSLIKSISENLPTLLESAKSVIQLIVDALLTNLPLVLEFGIQLLNKIAEGISQNLTPLLTTAISIITQLINSLVAQLPAIINVGLQLITVLADGIIKALPNLIAQLPTIINGIINALLSAIPMIIETGVKLLTSLAENLPTIIDSLVNSIDLILDNLIDALIDNAPMIAEAGVKLFIALLKNLPKIIVSLVKGVQTLTKKIFDKFIEKAPAMASTGLKLLGSLFNKLPEILTLASKGMKDILDAIIEALDNNPLVEVGRNLIKGLWNGINDMKDWIIGLVKGFANGIIDNIEKIFGINSPSKVFAQIGRFLAQGLGVGWEDAIPDVQKAIEGDMNFDVGKLSSDIETSIKTTTEDGYYNLNDVYRTMNKILEQIEVSGANTVSAIENTDTSIVLNDREFGRAVRKVYA